MGRSLAATIVILQFLSLAFPGVMRAQRQAPPAASDAAQAVQATITVNSTGDQRDFDDNDGVCRVCLLTNEDGDCVSYGGCTLRAALEVASESAGPDQIFFSLPSGSVIQPAGSGLLVDEGTTLDGKLGTSGRVILDGSKGPVWGLLVRGSGVEIRNMEIRGFTRSPALEVEAQDVAIRGCYIHSNTTGVYVTADDVTIGGNTPGDRNVISGNGTRGVVILGGSGAIVQGNYIGLAADGLTAEPNLQAGLALLNADSAFVGGMTAAARNVISGNASTGVLLGAGGDHRVVGNYIGTSADGSVSVGNESSGVYVQNSRGNRIGGASPGERNVISGNGNVGVQIGGVNATGNAVQGNYIGTDATGRDSLANVNGGVYIDGAPDNMIGGTVQGAGNVISGNRATGITIANADAGDNAIQGNYIGTDATGMAALGNGRSGIYVYTAPRTKVGGTTAAASNIISANGTSGVVISGSEASENVVQGNYIGLNAAGTDSLSNGQTGVFIDDAPGNTIGGTDEQARNVIAGNRLNGVSIRGVAATGNKIQGNYIGTDAAGTDSLGNRQAGVYINGAPQNQVGDTVEGARNVVSANGSAGIVINGSTASGNTVQGNYVGTNKDGTGQPSGIGGLGNAVGIFVSEAPQNIIGGTDSGARNLISGNKRDGILIRGADAFENRIEGNYIGTDVSGENALDNGHGAPQVDGATPQGNGIRIDGAPRNLVGGTSTAARNVIAGNQGSGIRIVGIQAAENRVLGNRIGLFANLANPRIIDVGNGDNGISIIDAPRTVVGGAEAGARNIISHNQLSGVAIIGPDATKNVVQGNYIGSAEDGTTSWPNHEAGVFIDGAPANRIGGSTEAKRNVISGNRRFGVAISESSAVENVVQGNYIGVAADGTTALGNGQKIFAADPHGVRIRDARNNLIGGTRTGEGNVIAHNAGNGVYVLSGTGNRISGNSIFGNEKLGIDLDEDGDDQTDDGVTKNDPGDADTNAANELQNYPVIVGIEEVPGRREYVIELRSRPGQTYRLEFFDNDPSQSSGPPEGKDFLDSLELTTDASGIDSARVTFPGSVTQLTITATDPDGNTSEFFAGFVEVTAIEDVELRTNEVSGAQRPDDLLLVDETWRIEWTSSSVESVDLLFSPDSGATTYEIVQGLPAEDEAYEWTVPDSLAAKSMIVIRSSDTPSIRDTSDVFKVKDFELTRFTEDGEYELYEPHEDGWGFPNDSASMWPKAWWSQFDYESGTDPFTGRPYSPVFVATTYPEPPNFPDWPLFVETFTHDVQFYHTPTGNRLEHSPSGMAQWIAHRNPSWKGSCFGFSVSSLLAFDDPAQFLKQFPGVGPFKHLAELKVNDQRRLVINKLQLHWNGAAREKWVAEWKQPVDDLLDELKAMLVSETRDDKVLLLMADNESAFHAVVPYHVDEDPNTPRRENIYVYDPNYPNFKFVDFEVVVDLTTNAWVYQTSNWGAGGSTPSIALSPPASVVAQPPHLQPLFEEKPASAKREVNEANGEARAGLAVYNTPGMTIEVTAEDGRSIGYADSLAFNDVEGALPIIPPTGTFHSPIGYVLPAGPYTLQMSRFPDSSAYAFVFTDSLIYTYERFDAQEDHTDHVTYSDGLDVSNEDAQAKDVRLGMILPKDARERAFDVTGVQLSHGEQLSVQHVGTGSIRLSNTGDAKSYDLRLTTLSESQSATMDYGNIPLAENAHHVVRPDWEGLDSQPVTILIDADRDGVADDSLHVEPDTGTAIEGNSAEVPDGFDLKQNYPNPFNPTTTIGFDVPEPSHIRLAVYDVLGRIVATPVDEAYQPGRHEILFDAGNLPSGTYFYRIEMGDFSDVRKMVVVK